MTIFLLTVAIVMLLCVLLNRVTDRVGVPILLAFILLGMLFGSDGIWKISFDNFRIAEQICSVALIFIMFYGGFGTNWNQAKPVAVPAAVLSTLGVALTAGFVGVFCWKVLGMDWKEGLLLGSVIGSTDAASVFSILRSKSLGLKYNTASLLEMESGSNDPCSYMMTVLMLAVMGEGISAGAVIWMVFTQFAFGIMIALLVSAFALWMLRKFRFPTAGFDMIFVMAMALFAYAAASLIGGNGYLSVYIVGIILGNSKIKNKSTLVPFFDGITGMMQMTVFFLLGLLSFPSRLPFVIATAVAVALFLTFVARPLAVFLLMLPFGGKFEQKVLISFAGLRGAASIVFAIMAMVSGVAIENDIFHIVFCIVLLSISFQGSLIPWASRRLAMIDEDLDVRKTFTDYVEEVPVQFVEVSPGAEHPWVGRPISQLDLMKDLLIVAIQRGKETVIPGGSTVIEEGDRIVLSGRAYRDDRVQLLEKTVEKGGWAGKRLSDCSKNPQELVVLIRRGEQTLIPRGDTILEAGDVLVIHSRED